MAEKDSPIRTFNLRLTINDLKVGGITPSMIAKAGEDWDVFLKIVKILQTSGPTIDENTPLNELKDIQKNLNL